jgi:GT2 family glycosyltransferase
MAATTVSVIICCYTFDRLDDLREAIRSVVDQTIAPDEIVIAVDNNPDLFDALRDDLSPSIKLVLNDRVRGLSETRNVAIEAASASILAFLDDDVIAEPNWLEHMLRAFRDPDVMAVAGESTPLWERGAAPRWFPSEYDFIVGCTGHKKLIVRSDGEVRSVTGSNMAFRADVFSRLGGWRQDLGRGQTKTGGEEAELCLRLKSVLPGARIVYEPSAVVRHRVGRERSTLRYVFSYAFNEGIVRAQLRKYALAFDRQPLAAEHLFVQRLVLSVIPQRLRRISQAGAIAQTFVTVVNTMLIAAGYARGRLISR